jgi:hypothetical protein
MVVVWVSAWPWAGITSSLYGRDAEEEGSVRALCSVAILAVVPWRCPGRAVQCSVPVGWFQEQRI